MRTLENRTYDLEIIAGKCSFNLNHLDEEYKMAEIQVPDGKGGMMQALSAERMVGTKSRTGLSLTEEGKTEGMGTDADIILRALITGSVEEVPPSISFAERFVKEMKMGVAAEIMTPHIQLPLYEGRIPKGMFMPWNPSNDQLGWHITEMAVAAGRNKWMLGLKHGKWLGTTYEEATSPGNENITSMESTWHGLRSYAVPFLSDENIVFIHRGVDVPEKGKYRNRFVHEAVQRVAKMFPKNRRGFDPNHGFGPKLRDEIMEGTIEAAKMKVNNRDEYLYNLLLIEVGTSETDSGQHLTVDELGILVREISKFRKLRGPWIPVD
ncbi:hypothetical protein HYU95_01250 [Candidatus Daviesbacteria bacterium]|nr:hypothetical protein [Candidatus Daviesbacteria bacterium]